jgi:hypothetical protein
MASFVRLPFTFVPWVRYPAVVGLSRMRRSLASSLRAGVFRRDPRPFGLCLHGNEGTDGAGRGFTSITTGLGWAKAAEYVVVSGKPSMADLEACWNLGATVAATPME